MKSTRFELVDGLRGLAALSVVMPHAVGLFSYQQESVLTRLFLFLADLGRSSVEVFFVVSGFAIAYSLRNSAAERFGLGRFLLRRAARLDPPYWAGMILCGLVYALRERATGHPVALPALGKIAAHVLYLQDILHLGQFNVVFWTLCLEFQLYLAFAGLVRVVDFVLAARGARGGLRVGADAYGWLMVAAFAASLLVSHSVWPMVPGWFVPFFYLFLSGSLAAWCLLGRVSERLYQSCLLAMGIGLIFQPQAARAFGLSAALVIYAAMRRKALHQWLAGPLPQWLGRISYSIYLVHAPVVMLFLGLRTRLSPESRPLSLICLFLAYTVTLGVAAIFHRLIEEPCLLLSRRLKRRSATPDLEARPTPLA